MAYTGKAIETILRSNNVLSHRATVISHEWYTEEESQVRPRIVLLQLESEPVLVKGGNASQTWEDWEIQIFTETADDAKTLSDSVVTALDGYTGTKESVIFKNSMLTNRLTDNETKSITLEFKFYTE